MVYRQDTQKVHNNSRESWKNNKGVGAFTLCPLDAIDSQMETKGAAKC